MPSVLPSTSPSTIPSNFPSQKPSLLPSMQPSFRSVELQFTIALQLPRDTEFDVASVVCEGVQSYLDGVTKSIYGNDTETTISCLPVVVASTSENLFDRARDVTAVMTTFFPQAAVAPNITEYDSHVLGSITSDEAAALLPGIVRAQQEKAGVEVGSTFKIEFDDSSETPVLKVSFEEEESSGMHQPSLHLGCILSSLYLLFFLVN